MMKARIEFAKAVPDAFPGMWAFEKYVRRCGLDPALLKLIKII